MQHLPGIAWLAIVASVGCSQVLGFKDPTLEDPRHDDASIAAASDAPIDMAVTAIDAAPDAVTDAATDASVDAPIDGTPACAPSACPFGCDPDTNACRDGKLWIFKTGGAFFGNGFGGTDTPINVRGGADAKCIQTAGMVYGMRACNINRVHAVLHVSSADSIALMATKYSIPTSVPVHRADDGVLVSNNWNDLTDPTKALRAPATNAPAGDDATVWTGTNGVATCANWTSRLSTDSGTVAFTDRTASTWLSQGAVRCDFLFSLLCVCWSGGE